MARAAFFIAQGQSALAKADLAYMAPTGEGKDQIDDILMGSNLFLDAKLEEAAEWSLRTSNACPENPLVSGASRHVYTAAMSLGLMGRMKEFDEHIQRAQSLLHADLSLHYLVGAFSFAAHVYAARSMWDRANVLADKAKSLGSSQPMRVGYPSPAAKTVAEGHRRDGALSIWRAAHDDQSSGMIANAVVLGTSAASLDVSASDPSVMQGWIGKPIVPC